MSVQRIYRPWLLFLQYFYHNSTNKAYTRKKRWFLHSADVLFQWGMVFLWALLPPNGKSKQCGYVYPFSLGISNIKIFSNARILLQYLSQYLVYCINLRSGNLERSTTYKRQILIIIEFWVCCMYLYTWWLAISFETTGKLLKYIHT